MRITLPLPPNRANAREHWWVTDKNKKAYYQKADIALVGTRPPRVGRMRVHATLYVWGKMDRDNLMARLKWPLDCLVRRGLLVDDNEEWLDLQMPTQVIDRKNMRVEIELTPCDLHGKPKE